MKGEVIEWFCFKTLIVNVLWINFNIHFKKYIFSELNFRSSVRFLSHKIYSAQYEIIFSAKSGRANFHLNIPNSRSNRSLQYNLVITKYFNNVCGESTIISFVLFQIIVNHRVNPQSSASTSCTYINSFNILKY